MKSKHKWIPNPEWKDAQTMHFISHPDSGIVCECRMCRNTRISPLPDSGKIGKVYYAQVGKSLRWIIKNGKLERVENIDFSH